MNLIERYIQAVKNELPYHQREDIGRELRGSLQEALESESEQRQRPLTENETGEYLKRFGHPLRVASTYWTHRSLVSEAAYPLYKQALVLVFSLYVALNAVFTITDVRGAPEWGMLLFSGFVLETISMLMFLFIAITLVFHYFGDLIAAQPFFWRWNPMRLPNIENTAASLPRPETLWQLVRDVFAFSLLSLPLVQPSNSALGFNPGPVVVLRILVLVALALDLLNLLQPYWTRVKWALYALLGLGVGICLVQLLLLPEIIAVSSLEPTLSGWLNWSLRVTIAAIGAYGLWSYLSAWRRLIPVKLPWL